MSARPATVLLVDDDAADRELTRRALVGGGLRAHLEEVEGGEEALDYLRRRGDYANASEVAGPDLILLDLNMPRMNGIELLEAMQALGFTGVPIVVLTTSQADVDVEACYALGCASFLSKPVRWGEFAQVVAQLGRSF
ncbi:MAG: response regulator [Myxococcota bacterium]